ncbi:hypothetical protein LJ655_08950 [Paraburkholderia sp. MMS20-SJTN17]|uniref:Tryptophan leader peptide n=1 Tax=Paraburkholderia translucens TaxID=2886945 RepID=A0ABS8KB64_9BURK|nr:hypothetical protein [Paraburkholderia sp. MMS20-SJTN17]MCC8402019.1 hypothetical protein [Paraburkholderia sp. MMS20-SJTN17]
MKLKFWKKSLPQREAVHAVEFEWPVQINQSIRLLLGMYVHRDIPPFSDWKPTDVELDHQVESVAQIAANGYQLWVWFLMIRQKFGVASSEMARTAYCIHADELDKGLSDIFETLLAAVDRAISVYEATPEEKLRINPDGQSAELMPEYFIALEFLCNGADSPFFGQNAQDIQDEDWKVTRCVQYATKNAYPLFSKMIDALSDFDANSLDWKWRAQPGAFERHLQRRYENVLFAPYRRVVLGSEVLAARMKDDARIQRCASELSSISQQFYGQGDFPPDWHHFLNGTRERLDALYERLLCVGGDTSVLRQTIANLRVKVMELWRTMLQNDSDGLETLERAEMMQAGRHSTLFASDWMCQQREIEGEPAIPVDELVQALLTETPDEIAKTVYAYSMEPSLHESLEKMRDAARQLVADVRASGNQVPGIKDKLRALTGSES